MKVSPGWVSVEAEILSVSASAGMVSVHQESHPVVGSVLVGLIPSHRTDLLLHSSAGVFGEKKLLPSVGK